MRLKLLRGKDGDPATLEIVRITGYYGVDTHSDASFVKHGVFEVLKSGFRCPDQDRQVHRRNLEEA